MCVEQDQQVPIILEKCNMCTPSGSEMKPQQSIGIIMSQSHTRLLWQPCQLGEIHVSSANFSLETVFLPIFYEMKAINTFVGGHKLYLATSETIVLTQCKSTSWLPWKLQTWMVIVSPWRTYPLEPGFNLDQCSS